jgi:ubiquinone/menaquinone biosynthesis C-methylase UbiE
MNLLFWKKYHKDAIPEYLAKHYWWAYVCPFSIWFWDHQPLVNMILFGQYRNLVNATLDCFAAIKPRKTLQISAVYGSITPDLAMQLDKSEFHLLDITPGQLYSARRKLKLNARTEAQANHLTRMNATQLGYGDNSFDATLIFFLLHEMPPAVRRKILQEAIRVTEPEGHLIITEYGARTRNHFFHWFPPARWILGFFEPFVPGFIEEDLDQILQEVAAAEGKQITRTEHKRFFKGFYRNNAYRIGKL